ncbi:MAG: histidine phosphatase family protein [Pseudomonadales bacterium]|nr:histidine phosphatase family protein [Pseudomonadales bacterium]
MASLYLVRHGEIDANVQRLWFGSTDGELNARGVLQASRLGPYFQNQYPEISVIYSSPLKRTFKTAESLGAPFGIVPVAHEGLREYGIGEWEGEPYEKLAAERRFFERLTENPGFAPPGGESVHDVRDRMIAALTEIRDRHHGEDVAIVSHGAAMAIALAHLLSGKCYPFHDYHMSNTGISHLHWHDEPVLQVFDDIGHLPD